MKILAYVILGFAPGLFWLWYFRRKDDLEPEPRHVLLRVFGLGALSTGLILLLRPVLEAAIPNPGGMTGDAIDAFVITALPEEMAKLLAFILGVWFSKEFDEPLDGIMYGVAAGLGFASVENVLYVARTGTVQVVVLRAFTATLGHAAISGSLGFFFGLARFSRGGKRFVLMGTGIALAVALHGFYDFFLIPGWGDWSLVSLLGFLPLALVLLGLKINWTRKLSPEYHPDLARLSLRSRIRLRAAPIGEATRRFKGPVSLRRRSRDDREPASRKRRGDPPPTDRRER